MHLFIMRHGPSEAHAPNGRDYDRALTPNGRARTLAVARDLASRNERPSRILSSPLVRARETAQIVASTIHGGLAVEINDDLAPDGEAYPLIASLIAVERESVLVVGHEPNVSALAGGLLRDWRGSFEAAMVVALQITSGITERRFVLVPPQT